MNGRTIERSDVTAVTTHDAWMMRLWMAAPHIEWLALLLLADALDGSAPIEWLLIIRDRLAARAVEKRLAGHQAVAGELAALAGLVGREVSWRSPTLGLPRPA